MFILSWPASILRMYDFAEAVNSKASCILERSAGLLSVSLMSIVFIRFIRLKGNKERSCKSWWDCLPCVLSRFTCRPCIIRTASRKSKCFNTAISD